MAGDPLGTAERLHLFGYDHMTPEDEKVMFALQDEILDEVASREV